MDVHKYNCLICQCTFQAYLRLQKHKNKPVVVFFDLMFNSFTNWIVRRFISENVMSRSCLLSLLYTSYLNVALSSYIRMNLFYLDCKINPMGQDYSGSISQTKSGLQCQRWDSTSPHKHNFRGLTDQENFCRNPDNHKDGPWCYTTSTGTRWESCEVPYCCKFCCLYF